MTIKLNNPVVVKDDEKGNYYACMGHFAGVKDAKFIRLRGTVKKVKNDRGLELVRYYPSMQDWEGLKQAPRIANSEKHIVIECKTGFKIAGGDTLAELRENLQEILAEKSDAAFKQAMEYTIERHGLSPRYAFVDQA
jgi:hypothetical protein